jgi:hypothetical protein
MRKLFLRKETTSTRETRVEETTPFVLRKPVVSMRVEPTTGLLGSCCRASRHKGRAAALAIRKGCATVQAAPPPRPRSPSARRHAGHAMQDTDAPRAPMQAVAHARPCSGAGQMMSCLFGQSIFKSLSKSHSLNQHLGSHLHKNRFLYIFTLQQLFYIPCAL